MRMLKVARTYGRTVILYQILMGNYYFLQVWGFVAFALHARSKLCN